MGSLPTGNPKVKDAQKQLMLLIPHLPLPPLVSYRSLSNKAVLKKLLHPTKEPNFSSTALMAHKGKISFFASLLSYKGPQDIWIVDSGVTDHMCGSSARLLNFCPYTKDISITAVDGSLCKAAGRGDLMVFGLPLKSVLYVPKL